jgi:hypothetical protein
MTSAKKLRLVVWILGVSVIVLAITAWAQVRLTGKHLTSYDVFPVLGLSAFGLMWTHYVAGALKKLLRAPDGTLSLYFKATQWIVLALIVLHPGIFVTSLYVDDFGLPPFSYLSLYTDTFARIALLAGSTSLFIFLAFELHRWFRKAVWWKYVEYFNIAAMFAILYHGLTLGGELGLGWFKIVWLIYALTLAAAIVYNKVQHKRETNHHE